MTRPRTLQHDLLEALATGGCPLCTLTGRAVSRHLHAVANEGVNDIDLRARLRASRGFCNRHAYQFWEEVKHPLGVAMIYQDVVINLARALEATEPGAASAIDRVRAALGAPRARAAAETAALAPSAPCPACEVQRDAERRWRGVLLRALRDAAFVATYEGGDGLCLPHLTDTLAHAHADEVLDTLTRTQIAAWKALHGDLTEFIRLHDYRFRDEPRGAEQRAPRRALEAVAGKPNPR
jgi:hypothetical protein